MMRFLFGLIGLLLTTVSFAKTHDKEQLILTECLYQKVQNQVHLLAREKGYRLVEANLNDELLAELHKYHKTCGKFLNIAAYQNDKLTPHQRLSKFTKTPLLINTDNYPITHEKEVKQLLAQIDSNNIWQTNKHLTSYINRSASQQTGVEAAQWFKTQFDSIAQQYHRQDTGSYLVKTGNKYIQPSVVTVIGKGKATDAIVIGAHIDTLSGNMPGADDDSSGISVALEVARVLMASDLRLDHPVYIIAYAAEERGLVGSGYVVKDFLEKRIPVKAVMQLDQAGYRSHIKDTMIWLLTDFVDTKLTKFTANLMTTYLKIPVGYTTCGYACSDHANWHKEGYKACYPSATTLDDDNPYIHSENDRLEIINLDHMTNFAKLGVAFAVELGLDNK